MPSYSDTVVNIAFLAALGFVAATLGLLMVTLFVRVWTGAQEARRRSFLARWRPILAQCLNDVPETLPSIHPRDFLTFMEAWNTFQESLHGTVHDKLNELAGRTQLAPVSRQILHQHNVRKQLLALNTLGHLGDDSAWNAIHRVTADPNPFLSLTAAKALVRINAAASMAILIPLISRRTDWSSAKVVSILREAGPKVIAEPLAHAVHSASPKQAARLIRYVEATQSTAAIPLIRQYLQRKPLSDEVISACLHLFGQFKDPQDLEFVRLHLHHPTWYVRVQAATALGQLGTEEDAPRLVQLMQDQHWWVRLRAEEALYNLPLSSHDWLREVSAR